MGLFPIVTPQILLSELGIRIMGILAILMIWVSIFPGASNNLYQGCKQLVASSYNVTWWHSHVNTSNSNQLQPLGLHVCNVNRDTRPIVSGPVVGHDELSPYFTCCPTHLTFQLLRFSLYDVLGFYPTYSMITRRHPLYCCHVSRELNGHLSMSWPYTSNVARLLTFRPLRLWMTPRSESLP